MGAGSVGWATATRSPRSKKPRNSGAFDLTVGAAGESAFGARVDRVALRPGPAAEAGAAEIGEGLLQLVVVGHDEGAVLRDALADGPALQEQQLARLGAVHQRNLGVRSDRERRSGRDL